MRSTVAAAAPATSAGKRFTWPGSRTPRRTSMPWVLSKSYHVEASHQLPHHAGKCARLHRHSWRLTVEVRGELLHVAGPESGMVQDYGAITAVVAPLLDNRLDHWHLNDTTGLESPTSEALATWIYHYLED